MSTIGHASEAGSTWRRCWRAWNSSGRRYSAPRRPAPAATTVDDVDDHLRELRGIENRSRAAALWRSVYVLVHGTRCTTPRREGVVPRHCVRDNNMALDSAGSSEWLLPYRERKDTCLFDTSSTYLVFWAAEAAGRVCALAFIWQLSSNEDRRGMLQHFLERLDHCGGVETVDEAVIE